jgi:hypothetical protein
MGVDEDVCIDDHNCRFFVPIEHLHSILVYLVNDLFLAKGLALE